MLNQANLVGINRTAEPELVSLEEIQAKMDPVEAERLRTVRNIGIAVRVVHVCELGLFLC